MRRGGAEEIRSMHSFYIELAVDGEAMLPAEEAKHALKVLRLRPGDAVCAMNGAGRRWRGEIGRIDGGSVSVNLLEVVRETADVVIANIISDVSIMLAKPVRERIVDNGIFICSGISAERREDVLKALDDARYEVLEALNRGEWCAVAARKR